MKAHFSALADARGLLKMMPFCSEGASALNFFEHSRLTHKRLRILQSGRQGQCKDFKYYYHAHRSDVGEHDHFHTFLCPKGMPVNSAPINYPAIVNRGRDLMKPYRI